MSYRAGTAFIEVTPSLSGWQQSIQRQLRAELANLGIDVPLDPKVDPGQASKEGEKYGGAFGDAARRRIDAALKALPAAKLDADSSPADRKIAELRARLEELRDKRIGVDVTGAEAMAELRAIHGELDEVGRKHPDVAVRVNTAAAQAELAAVNAEVSKLDGKRATFDVDDKGSADRSKANINGLLLAGLALGPALIPVAAAVAAALGAIGTGAIAGIAGLGVLKLGFSGVTDGVKALDTFATQSSQNSVKNAAQQVSSANSIASAQDGVRNAVRGVADAQRSAAQANENAARQVVSAQRGVADASIAAGISVRNALQAQTQAEQALTQAQQGQLNAQVALTNARLAAQRQLESLTQQVEDGALAERQARIDIQTAQQTLDQTKANPAASQLQREQAQLTFDQSVQHLKDLERQNKNLAEDKAAADKAGVDGAQQVISAQQGVAGANQAVANAQQGVADAAANLAEAQRAGAERVAVAQEALAAAQQQQAETARAGLESIAKAQEAVIQAQRSLQNATVQAGAQGNAAMDTLNAAMAKLTPTGQQFSRFLYGLKPQFDSLKAAAQDGLLPGVEDGIKSLLPYLPSFRDFVGDLARVLGDLARQAGLALRDPFWQQFFGYLKSEAGPSTKTFGEIVGNLATGFAGLLEAFKPVWDGMGQGLKELSEKFANFGKDAASGKSDSFNGFLQYVKDTWPTVKELFTQLGTLVGNIIKSFSGQGGGVLTGVVDVLKFINVLPPGTLQLLIDLFIAYKGLQLAGNVYSDLTKTYDKVKGIADLLGDIKRGGGLKGSLAGAGGGIGTAATVVGGAYLIDQSTDGALTKTANKISGAPQASTGPGTDMFGAAPPKPGDETDLRNWPTLFIQSWRQTEKDVGDTWSRITGNAGTWWGQTKDTIGHANADAQANVKRIWSDTTGWLSGKWEETWGTANGWWQRLKDTIGGWAHGIYDTVTGWIRELGAWLSGKWSEIWGTANGWWGRLRDDVSNTAGDLWGRATGWIRRLGDDVAGAFQFCVDRVRDIWNRLADIAKQPVNFIIGTVYDQGIVPLWNGIAGIFNLGKLAPMPLLAEGGVLPGYAPGRDTIPAILSAGEGVLVPEAVRGLGADFVYQANAHFSGGRAKPSRGPYFAGGGIIDDAWNGLKSVAGAVVGGAKDAWGWFSSIAGDISGGVRKLFGPVFDSVGRTPGVGPWTDALKAIPGKLVDAVVSAAKNLASSAASFFTGGSGVERWRDVGLQALAITGQPASEWPRMAMQMRSESGGNPGAVNLYDINAQHGTPSVGLLQVIGPTYQRWKLPPFDRPPFAYGVSEDPLSNILAATRYTLGRYGSLAAGWHGHGYDQGGWLPPGITMAVNNTGVPERVLTGPQWQAVSAARTTGGDQPIVINVHPRAEHDEAQIADMVSRRLSFAMRAG